MNFENEYRVPDWALPALINDDWTGLSDGEELQIRQWIKSVAEDLKLPDGKCPYFIHRDGFNEEFGRDDITGLWGAVEEVVAVP